MGQQTLILHLPNLILQTSLLALLQEVGGEEDLITAQNSVSEFRNCQLKGRELCPTGQVPAQQQRARSPWSKSLFARSAGPS